MRSHKHSLFVKGLAKTVLVQNAARTPGVTSWILCPEKRFIDAVATCIVGMSATIDPCSDL